jgi:hypothetical protein
MEQLVSSGHVWRDQIPSLIFPELFSYAKNRSISFHRATTFEPFHRLFHLPLSEIAYDQLRTLEQTLLSAALSQEPDSWSYIGGAFTSSLQKPRDSSQDMPKITQHSNGSRNLAVRTSIRSFVGFS